MNKNGFPNLSSLSLLVLKVHFVIFQPFVVVSKKMWGDQLGTWRKKNVENQSFSPVNLLILEIFLFNWWFRR